MKKEINQLKAGTLLTYLTMIVSSVIPILYTPLMLQLLGQNEYGLYNLSNSVTSYLSWLGMGLATTLLRFYLRYLAEGNKLMAERVMGLFSVIFGIIAVVMMAVGCCLTLFTNSLFNQGLSSDEISRMNILIIILSINSFKIDFDTNKKSLIIVIYPLSFSLEAFNVSSFASLSTISL